MSYIIDIVVVFVCYILGCFNTGYYLVRLRQGRDIRSQGSGNAGTRNAARAAGKLTAALTFLGDAGKGAVAIVAASSFDLELWATMLAMIAVTAGHIWPFQLGFRGGKGVATGIGAMMVLDWQVGLVLLVVTGIAFAITRRFTPSGLIAVLLAPAASAASATYVTCADSGQRLQFVLGICVVTALILFAHRRDIRAILKNIH